MTRLHLHFFLKHLVPTQMQQKIVNRMTRTDTTAPAMVPVLSSSSTYQASKALMGMLVLVVELVVMVVVPLGMLLMSRSTISLGESLSSMNHLLLDYGMPLKSKMGHRYGLLSDLPTSTRAK